MMPVHFYRDRAWGGTRGLWFRIGCSGPGLHVRLLPAHDPWRYLTFSERYGYRKVWLWGRLAVTPLRPVRDV